MRENDYFFPIVETIHILGLSLSVGIIMWLDLRLIGISMQRYRVKELVGQLEKLAISGFLVMFISGILLLCSEPLKCYTIFAFRLKLIMLPLAGLNVCYFHSKAVLGTVSEWDEGTVIPWRARLVGILSLALWFGIIAAGRWTAYTS
jgi:hypothetical protein